MRALQRLAGRPRPIYSITAQEGVRGLCSPSSSFAKLERLSDLTAGRVQEALATLRARGKSLATCNHHRNAICGFSRWVWKEGRLPADPLVGVVGYNAQEDIRHDRRTLALDELRR